MTDYGDAVIDVRLDTTRADRQLKDLVADLQKAVRTFENQGIDISVGTDRAQSNLKLLVDRAQAAARAIEGLDTDVRVDTSRSEAKIEQLVRNYRQTARQIESSEIDVKVDTSRAEAKINSLDRTLRRLIGVVAGAQLAGGLARLTGGISGFAIGAVGEIENLQIGLQGLNQELGDTSPISDQFVADLKGIASTSTIAFDTLASSAQKFRATFGQGFDNTGLVQTLGDVNALLGGSTNTFDRASLALTQIAAKGVQLEEINQLREALPGFDALGAIAEARGISVAETFKLIEERGVTGAEGIDILVAAMEDFPGAAGAMERQSQTLTGSIQNLQTVLSLTASTAFGPFGFAVSTAVSILRGATLEGGAVADVFSDVNDALTDTVQDGLGSIVPAVLSLGEAFTILIEGASPLITQVLPELVNLAPETAEGVSSIISIVVSLSEAVLPLVETVLPGLVLVLNDVSEVADVAGPALTPIIGTLVALKGAAFLTGGNIRSVTSGIAGFVSTVNSAPGPRESRLQAGIESMSDSARKATSTLSVAAAGIGAYAFATQEGGAKIAGAVSSVTGVVTAFAVGGPVAGLFAGAAAGVGLLAGEFSEAQKAAKRFEDQVSLLAQLLETEFGAQAPAIEFGVIFDNEELNEQLKNVLSEETLATIREQRVDLTLLADLQLVPESEFGTIEEQIADFTKNAQAVEDLFPDSDLGPRRFSVSNGFAGLGRENLVEEGSAIAELIELYQKLDAAQAERLQADIEQFTLAISGDPVEDQLRQRIEFINELGGVTAAAAAGDGVLEQIFGPINSLDEYLRIVELIEGGVGGVGDTARDAAPSIRQIGDELIASQLEANALVRELDPLRQQLEVLGITAGTVELSNLEESELDKVKTGLMEVQELISGFASDIGTSLIPDFAGTVDQVRDQLAIDNEILLDQIGANNAEASELARDGYDERLEGARTAFDNERDQALEAYENAKNDAREAYDDQRFAAKEAFDAVEDQAGRFKYPDFDFPDFEFGEFTFPDFEDLEFPELPEPPPVTIRAVIDQFQVNQESAAGITDQFSDLIDAGFSNITFELGNLLNTDPEQVDAFLAELFPEGVLAENVAAEFDTAIGANSAAQAKIVSEWTTIAETIAPILGQAIATELAAVLGVEYNVSAILGFDLAAAQTVLANTAFSVTPSFDISADALRNLATTNLTGVASLLGVDATDVFAEIQRNVDINGNVVIDRTELDDLSNEDLAILLNIDTTQVDEFLEDPVNVQTFLEVDSGELQALADADPVLLKAILGLNQRELNELLEDPTTIPSRLRVDTTALAELAEDDPISVAALLGVDPSELDEILALTYDIDTELNSPDETPITAVTEKLRRVEAQFFSDGEIEGAPTEVEVGVRFSAESLASLAAVGIAAGIPLANGGIISGAGVQVFKNGGFSRGAENHVAQIAQGQTPFRMWAEPETGGEAYIPLSPMKRARSEEILQTVATKFGKEVVDPGHRGGFDAAANSSMLERMDMMLQQMRALAGAVAQMPPITVQASGGDPENAASKIFWGHRKRLESAGSRR